MKLQIPISIMLYLHCCFALYGAHIEMISEESWFLEKIKSEENISRGKYYFLCMLGYISNAMLMYFSFNQGIALEKSYPFDGTIPTIDYHNATQSPLVPCYYYIAPTNSSHDNWYTQCNLLSQRDNPLQFVLGFAGCSLTCILQCNIFTKIKKMFCTR